MPTYKTPDVYVEEISIFPPSVAEVETAVPAFIGYTARDTFNGRSHRNKPTRIKALAEYKEIYGEGPNIGISGVELDDNHIPKRLTHSNQYYMYDSLELFFANGGGKCYIVSVGTYGSTIQKSELKTGLDQIALEDEPTLLLFPDAPLLSTKNDFYALQQDALSQAAKLMDRFVIMDLLLNTSGKTDFQEFRDKIGINNLKYGAAYMPYLKTVLPKNIMLRDLLNSSGTSVMTKPATVDPTALTENYHIKANIESYKNLLTFKRKIAQLTEVDALQLNDIDTAYKAYAKKFYDSPTQSNFNNLLDYVYDLLKAANDAEAMTNNYVTTLKASTDTADVTAGTAIENASLAGYIKNAITNDVNTQAAVGKLNAYIIAAPGMTTVSDFLVSPGAVKATQVGPVDVGAPAGYSFSISWGKAFTEVATLADPTAIYGNGTTVGDKLNTAEPFFYDEFKLIKSLINDMHTTAGALEKSLEDILTLQVPSYKNIKEFIAREEATIPPSGIIAGIYSKVYNNRGVWKAPANVSINSVFDVTEKIDNQSQEELNVDVVAGKSINAIRPFAGKGILVWGARTLAGNDNEWRYISVRRFFNMVEESIKKSTYWAVFEPNDANLWVKVKAMVENYLTDKWRDGALAGAKPEDAFFVNVGLGKTMTSQDILEGRLIVEIGMAVVRPAEFIILRFMHKMQES
jgi:phage tail sheath protein FI